MRIVNYEQGSDEWLALRREHKMASETPVLFGAAPYPPRTPLQLWELKVLGREPDRSQFLDIAAERGHRLEPKARAAYERVTNIVASPRVVLGDDHFGASLDAVQYSLKDQSISRIAEIKAPIKGWDSRRGEAAVSFELLEHDHLQVQHQLLVTRAPVCDFCVYDAKRDDNLIVEVTPDPALWERIISAWAKFWPHVEDWNPPEETDADYVQMEPTPDWLEAVEAYRELNEAKKKAQKVINDHKAAREHLVSLAGERSVIGDGIKITHFYKRGNINYKGIPAVKAMGADLEQYRGKGRYEDRISIIEE